MWNKIIIRFLYLSEQERALIKFNNDYEMWYWNKIARDYVYIGLFLKINVIFKRWDEGLKCACLVLKTI